MTERSYIAVKAKVKTVCFVSRLSSMRYPKVYPVGQGQVPIAFGGKDAKAQRVFRDVLISSIAIIAIDFELY